MDFTRREPLPLETGGAGPYAAVGTLTFDGKGNCKRRQSVSRNGAFETNHLSDQYEVAGNCTGKFLFNGGEFETFVIANEGTEIYILKEGAQTTYLVAKKSIRDPQKLDSSFDETLNAGTEVVEVMVPALFSSHLSRLR